MTLFRLKERFRLSPREASIASFYSPTGHDKFFWSHGERRRDALKKLALGQPSSPQG